MSIVRGSKWYWIQLSSGMYVVGMIADAWYCVTNRWSSFGIVLINRSGETLTNSVSWLRTDWRFLANVMSISGLHEFGFVIIERLDNSYNE